MAKTLFKHSRKGDINDYYNMQEGELGRYVESFVQCVLFRSTTAFRFCSTGNSLWQGTQRIWLSLVINCSNIQHVCSRWSIESSNAHFCVVFIFRGASSVVKMGKHKGTKKDYAIKIITRTVSESLRVSFSILHTWKIEHQWIIPAAFGFSLCLCMESCICKFICQSVQQRGTR